MILINKDILKVLNKKMIVFQMLCYNQTAFNSLFSKAYPGFIFRLE